jgi:hypothetical protein
MTDQDETEFRAWVLEPTWQNFSSMYREAVCAQEASTGMEVSHHRMAALYFGISTVECLLNREMTRYQLHIGLDHDEIHQILRKSELKKKIKTWPSIITGRELSLRPKSMPRLLEINDLRGHLTHLKNYWPDTFNDLGRTDQMQVVELVAEYIIALYQAKGELFPYWVWGWNYLSPSRDGYQIVLLPYTQIFHSLRSLGFKFQQQSLHGSDHRAQEILTDFDGYQKVASFLRSCSRCEPKWDLAPHHPKYCRQWWDASHQKSCGGVAPEAIARALQLDEERTHRMKVRGSSTKIKPASAEQSWEQLALKRITSWLGR